MICVLIINFFNDSIFFSHPKKLNDLRNMMRMKIRKLNLTIVAISIVTLLGFFSTKMASGAPSQWFPVNGTKSDYEITQVMQYNNNTLMTTNRFDVYNYSIHLHVIPTIFHHKPSVGWISIKNNTVVKNTTVVSISLTLCLFHDAITAISRLFQ